MVFNVINSVPRLGKDITRMGTGPLLKGIDFFEKNKKGTGELIVKF